MRLTFYFSSKHKPSKIPENNGFNLDEILGCLKSLEDKGQTTYGVIDTSTLSGADLFDAYITASAPAILKGRTGYNVSHVFGTRRSKGIFFGREIPALSVYGEMDQIPTDIYPHRKGQAIITISEFLEMTLNRV